MLPAMVLSNAVPLVMVKAKRQHTAASARGKAQFPTMAAQAFDPGGGLVVPGDHLGGHRQEPTRELGNPASGAAARRVARNALAQFDRSAPGWKVRMEALVGLAKAGRVVEKLAVIVNASRELES